MAISARLSRTLHQELGNEAAEDLVNWMVQMEVNRSDLRDMMDGYMVRLDRQFAMVVKWSFVFWCGAVGAIAMLARALR